MTAAAAPGADERRGAWLAAWRRMGPVKRTIVAILAAFLAANLILAALDAAVGGGDPSGPTSSSLTNGPTGVSAWADLLAAHGHRVVRAKQQLDHVTLDPAHATVVVADPDGVTSAEARALARFVAGGGRIVIVGESATPLLDALTHVAVTWQDVGPPSSRRLAPAAEVDAADHVTGAGSASYEGVGGLLPVLGGGSSVTGVVGDVGRGRVVALADDSPLQNGRLDQADDAGLALGVVGVGRDVVFAEAAHGFGGSSSGLSALPSSWHWAGLVALVALLVGMWSAGQRFGPPEDDERRLRPPRRDHVDALAADLARVSRDPADAAAPVVAAARRRLLDRLGLPRDASADQVRAAAHHVGLAPDDVEPLLRAPTTAAELVAAGAAAARLREPARTASGTAP